MTTTNPYDIRCEAERIIGEDRVPTDVLATLIADYGDSAARAKAQGEAPVHTIEFILRASTNASQAELDIIFEGLSQSLEASADVIECANPVLSYIPGGSHWRDVSLVTTNDPRGTPFHPSTVELEGGNKLAPDEALS